MQQGDVLIFHTADGGNINVVNGIIEMTGGFGPAIYYALFGGNVEDDGRDNNPKTWWGNIEEDDPHAKLVSRFQYLLFNINPNSSNLKRLEDAAQADLKFFKDLKIAKTIDIVTSIPALNKLDVVIDLDSGTIEQVSVNFLLNWRAMSSEFT
jgi:hypothetical protein